MTYQLDEPFYEISKSFLDEFPRIIGNACFLILELAVLQLPILTHTPFLLQQHGLFLFVHFSLSGI